MFKAGDWVLIVYRDEKRYLRKIDPKGSINVKKEVLKFSEIIGKEEGFRIGSFTVFKPTLEDIILLGFRRKTQIIYPKDTFFIAFKLDIKEGSKVFEFGTGSGCTTAVLSRLVGSRSFMTMQKKIWRISASEKMLSFSTKIFLKQILKKKVLTQAL